jgi:hypothetical protein
MRKALLIGMHQDVVDDAIGMFGLLASLGYEIPNMRIICDSAKKFPNYRCRSPTTGNIIKGIRWLINHAEKGDTLILFWSGIDITFQSKVYDHVRYMTALIGSLPSSVTFVMMFDSCPFTEWPFSWNAKSLTDSTVVMKYNKSSVVKNTKVILYTGGENIEEFITMDVKDLPDRSTAQGLRQRRELPSVSGLWYSCFCRSIMRAMMQTWNDYVTPIEFLLKMRESVDTDDYQPICCVMDPVYFHNILWNEKTT